MLLITTSIFHPISLQYCLNRGNTVLNDETLKFYMLMDDDILIYYGIPNNLKPTMMVYVKETN